MLCVDGVGRRSVNRAMTNPAKATFEEAVSGLLRGDFSELAPLFFDYADGSLAPIVEWQKSGRFSAESKALEEALTCACFNGARRTAEFLLKQGVKPSGGAGTGLDAFHWAVNRGQREIVDLLLQHRAPLETRNMYGGTVLGCAVWSALSEPRPTHLQIIESLVAAGANRNEAKYPSGNPDIDRLLKGSPATKIDPGLISFVDRFPRSRKYSVEWLKASASGGANPLWLAEWLSEAVALKPGMRVLDLGCGRAASSIFLHREFGVQVWATDLWFSASENYQRIVDAGVEQHVFPIHSDARSLPFAREFFDVILSIDSFIYYGTDDLFLSNIGRFLKPGGLLGIAGAGVAREMGAEIPSHLKTWWDPALCSLHSAAWWRQHWTRSGLATVLTADELPEGWKAWVEWQRMIAPENEVEIAALEADRGQNLGYVRVVARLNPEVRLEDPPLSIPPHYQKRPLLGN
jgi:ubiquinone/menaquinone biosynthesis C-methylase UbiE